ncbi:uncharacterized protein BJ171DRAFT_600691 [Polychytrium aggregatum]|uniref:uncharacterized protein n=1 Tax=Polychytrium aggregatum TaxID=110093 RepID=UPI0022FE2822|nr:uncharacterized protein BJ171DRAFT_600691 [Polychytrium aggregatum]KAI9202679.1 hypothetical protein BJ171DRAFT_600691 [Polychytrium aggregatum]
MRPPPPAAPSAGRINPIRRNNNIKIGGALVAFALATFLYSMNKVRSDEFDNIPMPPEKKN